MVKLTIDGKTCRAQAGETVLQVARREDIDIPTLCHLEGLSIWGACRLCLVEVENSPKLQPACALQVADGLSVQTHSPRLHEYRKLMLELLFAEGNHVCAVCVANGDCELQDLAVEHGLDHVDLAYQFPTRPIDLTHPLFGFDANRCILCSRCVRTCDEIEGAHTWDIAGRGADARVVTDMSQAWGSSISCTSCGKCVSSCPVGALFQKGSSVASVHHQPGVIEFLQQARGSKEWQTNPASPQVTSPQTASPQIEAQEDAP
ncbi:MAG: bidirectional hydrogenase complex protein HoxU [Deinococcota bacterium]